jgi:hypothetical protein
MIVITYKEDKYETYSYVKGTGLANSVFMSSLWNAMDLISISAQHLMGKTLWSWVVRFTHSLYPSQIQPCQSLDENENTEVQNQTERKGFFLNLCKHGMYALKMVVLTVTDLNWL